MAKMLAFVLLVTVGLVQGASVSHILSRLDAIEQAFPRLESNLNRRLLDMKRHLEDEGECQGFIDNGRCFTVVIIGVGGLNYYDAKRVCSYDGSSKIGNIYTQTQFNKLRDHVRARKAETALTFINVWTDMTRSIPSGVMRLRNGGTPSYNGYGNFRSSTEWRTDESRRTNVYVSFWTDGQNHDSNPGGYGNVWPTFGWNAALCERVIR